MLRFIAPFIIMIFSFSAFAQDQKAETILDDVRSHYENYSFQSDFTMEIDIPEAPLSVMNGTLYLSGDQFKFETQEQTVISDNVNLWFWTKTEDIDEVQISHMEEAEDIISPSDVFGVYLEGFSAKLVSETPFEGKNLALVELVPSEREDSNPYFKVKVVVNTNEDKLQQLQIFYKDGTVYTFKIKNEKQSNFGDGFFSFDESKFPETEVIDLR